MEDVAYSSGSQFTIIVSTAYGQMLVNRHDTIQTRALLNNGVSDDHAEIKLLTDLLRSRKPNPVAVDVGANFGTYTLALASAASPRGRVYAFEPQRIIYHMLAGTIALNSLTNVYCYNVAVGDREGMIAVPQYDYALPLNFGGVEFGPVRHEVLTQEPSSDPSTTEQVHITTLDCLQLKRADLIKIDVEGMEMEVLSGARQTIQTFRPILYVEFLKSDAKAIRAWLAEREYEIFPTVMNYLAIPVEDIRALAIARQAMK